jgi:hypothetical protein
VIPIAGTAGTEDQSNGIRLAVDHDELVVPHSIPERRHAPIHIPFFFEAAILSRMRSPMTSPLELREGQQNVQGQAPHRGGRVELLRHRYEGRSLASRTSTILAKSASERVSRSIL